MGDRFDLFRSILRSAAGSVRERIAGEGSALGRARQAAADIGKRRAGVTERAIARAALHLRDVRSASVQLAEGAIRIDLELDDGRVVRAALIPETARFAPRGAKELVFRAQPPEASGDPRVRELVGRLAGLSARALWSPVLGAPRGAESDEQGTVDRDGALLAIDLRTVPSVRAVQHRAAAQAVLDAIQLERFAVEDGQLCLVIGLPTMPI